MRRGCQTNQADRCPQAADLRGEDNRHHAQRADEHRHFAPAIDPPSAFDQCRRQPAATNAADIGNQLDSYQWKAHGRKIQPVVLAQKIGNPEEVEPPDRIGHELANRKSPSLPMAHQL